MSEIKQKRDGSRTIIKAQQAIAKSELTQVYRSFVKGPTPELLGDVVDRLRAYAELFGDNEGHTVSEELAS